MKNQSHDQLDIAEHDKQHPGAKKGLRMTDVENIRADIRHVQEQLDSIHELLNGSGGGLGLVGKVLVLWRSYVWVAGLCGVVLGSLATKLLEM